MKVVLAGSDLDRTLIYSRRALGLGADSSVELTCVETYRDQPSSFMTVAAARLAFELAELVTFVPVTTRTPAQLARVVLPGRLPPFAVASNGGVLMVDGVRDESWHCRVVGELGRVAPLGQVWDYVTGVCRPEWTSDVRNADDLFCYAVIDRSTMPLEFIDDARDWALQRGWTLSLQGRKLYWMPSTLTKAAAILEIAERISAQLILTAGDSLLDRDLLECAHRSIRPRHGELFESRWTHPASTVTTHSGVRAGEEILRWFTATAEQN